MNAVGIDISRGKSMVAVLRPFGEVVSCYKFSVLDFWNAHAYGAFDKKNLRFVPFAL